MVSEKTVEMLVFLCAFAVIDGDPGVTVSVSPDMVLGTFDPRFASITQEIQDFIGFQNAPWDWDWNDNKLKTMVHALKPLVVRCGGTWEDGIWWFLLMLICQIGIPIWWILKFMGDRREFQYLKYPAMLYWGGLTGCIVCQVLLA